MEIEYPSNRYKNSKLCKLFSLTESLVDLTSNGNYEIDSAGIIHSPIIF